MAVVRMLMLVVGALAMLIGLLFIGRGSASSAGRAAAS